VSSQSLDEGYGAGSPLDHLVQVGGAVVLLGAPVETVTLLHYAEYLAHAAPKRWVEYDMPVLVDGERVWRRIRELDSSTGALPYDQLDLREDAFAVMVRSALSSGVGRTSRVGAAPSHLLPAGALVSFAVGWLESRFRR
jgi:aminoglycoside 3-N-acetyltransferase